MTGNPYYPVFYSNATVIQDAEVCAHTVLVMLTFPGAPYQMPMGSHSMSYLGSCLTALRCHSSRPCLLTAAASTPDPRLVPQKLDHRPQPHLHFPSSHDTNCSCAGVHSLLPPIQGHQQSQCGGCPCQGVVRRRPRLQQRTYRLPVCAERVHGFCIFGQHVGIPNPESQTLNPPVGQAALHSSSTAHTA